MHGVQVSLQQVLDALAEDRIDPKRAGLMLYALQQAAAALNSTPEWKGSRPQVEIDHPLRAIEAPSLESHYQLPDDIDLAAPPDVAAAEAELSASLPSGPHIVKPRPARLERVPNFRPRLFFQAVDDLHADDKDDGPTSYKALRRALDEALAARAGVPDTEDESSAADGPLPARFYGEGDVADETLSEISWMGGPGLPGAGNSAQKFA